MSNYLELRAQGNAILQEAEKLRLIEVQGVVQEIRTKAAQYNLTSEDIFGEKTAKAGKAPKAGKGTGIPATEGMYQHPDGRTWTGRGRRPNWIVDAAATPEGIEQFKVGGSPTASPTLAAPAPAQEPVSEPLTQVETSTAPQADPIAAS